jgi:S-(hydroxymethyl)glutathione dehydrogenase/alcohol dehydrogenase
MKGRAAILVEQKKPLVIEEIEMPLLRFGQVLVQVDCSGICGSQIGEINGVKGPDKFLPHLLGHEGSGRVLECGEGVRTVNPGDHVVLHWRKGAGLDGPPPKYKSKFGEINAGWVTSFNEYAVVSESRVTKVPDHLDVEVTAMMGCAVTTGFGVINNNAHLKIGESIVIIGAGGIGLNIVQAAAMVGGNPIVAVDLHPSRLELARSLGATETLLSAKEGAEEAIRALIGSHGADVVVDNTGNPRIIEMAYRLTAETGRTILVGVPAKGDCASIYTLPLHFDKRIEGSHGGESLPEIDIPRYVRLHEAGKLQISQLVGKRYSLDQINEAIEDMRIGRVAGRCMIHMQG